MNSKEERNLAKDTYAGTFTPFCQGMDDYCIGYVSWWVRKRAKNKSIWLPAYFTPFQDRFISDDEDKGNKKGKEFQDLFFGKNADRDYITKGIRKGKIKTGKEILRLDTIVSPERVSQENSDALNLLKHFSTVKAKNAMATVSITADRGSHALGLDFSTETCFYFDPNLGEFQFTSEKNLSDWWRDCYNDRQNGKGAFAIMGNMFTMNIYSKI